ncbi:MAG: DUF2799 domain-containing protein [Gammaproteobacteria bacterium]|nr:DUF2799 domain-containing protein [Gammaproteobacteria bacterium]MDH5276478.1 DUF2799 domain-containing protein [Gammaproteobacteria bacterium]
MIRQTCLLAAAAALQLAGCASMSQSECQYSDWRAVGYEDGSLGRPVHDFGTYRKRCADHGVTPDFAAYQQGRDAGLIEYCQESRGFQEGSAGRSYAGVCPAHSEAGFLYGYHDGRTLHDLESGLRSADRQIRNHEARIRQIELELAEKTNALIAVTTTREERVHLVVETTQLAEERSTLKGEIPGLLLQREALQAELASARQELLTRR